MNLTKKKFVHLRNYTQYSLSKGALRIPEIINFCCKDDNPAVAISDFNNLFGSMEFSLECLKSGIQPIIGCNINLIDEKYEIGNILLLCKSYQGYLNLSKLISKSYLENSSGNLPFVSFKDLELYHNGIICLAGGKTGIVTKNYFNNSRFKSEILTQRFIKIFDKDFFIEIQRYKNENLKSYEEFLLNESSKYKIPLIATNENYFLDKKFKSSHDVLLCISQQKYLENDDRESSSNDSYIKNSQEMYDLFSDLPEVCENTMLIAKKCSFVIEEKTISLPKIGKNGFDHDEFLKSKSLDSLKIKISKSKEIQLKKDIYLNRLKFELSTIINMGFSSYFLIVSDFINWAKKNNIPVGPGRGSGAGSLVAWCLSITDLDPIKFGLLFERFLNPERVSLPDFDVDFCMDKRDEVIRYVQKKYGKSNVAQIITFGSFQPRAAIRDVGRVMQLPLQQIDEICKMIPFNPANPQTLSEYIDSNSKIKNDMRNDPNINTLFNISLNLEGLLRHSSTHAAGIVISDKPLDNILPLYKDPKSDFPVTQFSMKYVEKIGLIKFDFLGLKTLTVIQETCKNLYSRSVMININNISLNDNKTFKLLRSGLTAGIFQLEGQGMRETLVKVKPDRFEDLIAIVSLYRPGPMDNIPTYISRKQKKEKYEYIHTNLKEILDETYGIMVYQEQVMLIAQRLAGFSLAKADLLRRAMGKKIKSEMKAQKINFINGCLKNDIKNSKAEELFNEIEKFAGYGFNKSHAAAYAMIAFQTAFLKANYPLEFFSALMNCEIGNFEKLSIYCNEIKKMGFKISKPDINTSNSKFSVLYDKDKTPIGINFGLSAIKNIGETSIIKLVEEREKHGRFQNLTDLLQRVDNSVLNKRVLEALINSGSLNSIENNQKFLEDNIEKIILFNNNFHKNFNQNQDQLFDNFDEDQSQFDSLNYKSWDINIKLQKEIEAFGFYLSEHPTSFYESIVDTKKLKKISDLHISVENNSVNFLSSLVLVEEFKEKVSKNGKRFAFATFSDNTGFLDSICFSEVLDCFKEIPKAGDIFVVSFSIQIFKENKRLVIQKMKKIDFENNNSEKFTVSIDLQNINHKELRNLLNLSDDGYSRLSFKTSHQNYQIEIEYKKKIKTDLDFFNKLAKIAGVSNINSIN